jgi:tricorn protease-like protein
MAAVSLACHDPIGAPIQPIQTNTGIIDLSVVTSGPDPDPDGYYLYVENIGKIDLPTNGTRTVTGVKAGQWDLVLGGLSGNCVVEGPSAQKVNVTLGARVEVTFTVRCLQLAGLRVTVETGGVELDADGYQVELFDDGMYFVTSVSLPANGTVRVPGLFNGIYHVRLSQLAPNCDLVAPKPQSVTLSYEATVEVGFAVTCAEPRQLAFVRDSGAGADIYTVYSNGTRESQITNAPGADVNPAWSPDGSRIVFASDRNGNREIYVMSANGDNAVRLTANPAADYLPTWSPDGARIAFVSERDGNAEIYVMNADGTNPSRLTNNSVADSEPAWSPDGARIAFRSNRTGNGDIYVMNKDGSDPVQLTLNLYPDTQPTWSPDGKSIAFAAGVWGVVYSEDVEHDIYVMNADGSHTRPLTGDFHTDRTNPTWSADGGKIAFATMQLCGYYDYDCVAGILVVTTAGTPYSMTVNDATEPTWRP